MRHERNKGAPRASDSAPMLDPARSAQVKRVKNLPLAERMELLDRLCREQTQIATRARRVR